MKRTLLSLAAIAIATMSAMALDLKSAYEELKDMPDLEGVESNGWTDVYNGWIGALPVESAQVTFKAHEVGDGQTVYYGSKVENLARQLPKDQLILSGADFQNLLYIYAKPVSQYTSEILILSDQAYQGITMAIYGKVSANIIKAIKNGKVSFTPDHKIVVNVPILVFN